MAAAHFCQDVLHIRTGRDSLGMSVSWILERSPKPAGLSESFLVREALLLPLFGDLSLFVEPPAKVVKRPALLSLPFVEVGLAAAGVDFSCPERSCD